MTDDHDPGAGPPSSFAPERAGSIFWGLQPKLIVLTMLFVMLAEVLIFIPSIANFRVNWLNDRLTAGRLASYAIEATPGGDVPGMLRNALLNMAELTSVAVKQKDQRRLILEAETMQPISASYDLRPMDMPFTADIVSSRLSMIQDALAVFLHADGRLIRVIGSPKPSAVTTEMPTDFVEITLPEAALRRDMLRYSRNILALSLVISAIAATLIYFALRGLLVMPMLRLARNMMSFAQAPEDTSRRIVPSGREDEVGIVEHELCRMQTELSDLLKQKTRLASLGLAVAKINHDLRNLLSTAHLLSDRLGAVPDPTVQRIAPKLIASIDRATAFCNETLRYGRAGEAEPKRRKFAIALVVGDVAEGLGLPTQAVDFRAVVEPTLDVDADYDQLYRILNNLIRNAVDALSGRPQGSVQGRIRVDASREGGEVAIEVADNGPGVPEKARATLFQAFSGGVRPGGTGLGLAIASELAAAHGGHLTLVDTAQGATFRLTIPDRKA